MKNLKIGCQLMSYFLFLGISTSNGYKFPGDRSKEARFLRNLRNSKLGQPLPSMEHLKSDIKKVFDRYHPITVESFAELFSVGKVQNLAKGTLLLDIGKTSKHIHVLLKGSIVSHYLSHEGTTYHKNIFLEGDFVGSTVSALKSEPSHFALTVIEDCTVFSFEYSQFRALINKHQDLKNFYIAYLEKNWVVDKEKREIEIVMKEASERYADFITAHPNVENRIPLHYIASHLGVTPTQLSRIRKKIKKKDTPQHM